MKTSRICAIGVLILATAALAGEEVVREQWKWDLRDDTTGAPIKGADGQPIRTATEDECRQAGARYKNFRCTTTVRYTTVLNCDGVPKPPLATFTVLDENEVLYKGPYCTPGETCTTPPDWDVRSYVYTDIGGLRMNADGTTDEYVLVSTKKPPACWEWKWQRVPDPLPPVADNPADGSYPPAFAPGAFDGEQE